MVKRSNIVCETFEICSSKKLWTFGLCHKTLLDKQNLLSNDFEMIQQNSFVCVKEIIFDQPCFVMWQNHWPLRFTFRIAFLVNWNRLQERKFSAIATRALLDLPVPPHYWWYPSTLLRTHHILVKIPSHYCTSFTILRTHYLGCSPGYIFRPGQLLLAILGDFDSFSVLYFYGWWMMGWGKH